MEDEGEVKGLGELFQMEGEDEVPYILRNVCRAKLKRKITYDRPTCIYFICVEKIWCGRLQTSGYSNWVWSEIRKTK